MSENEAPAKRGRGRPRKEPVFIDVTPDKDPLTFLTSVMTDNNAEVKARIDAAKALMPFFHGRIGDIGKKAAQKDEAAKVAEGAFAPGAAPKLVSVK